MRAARALISRSALRHNLSRVRDLAAGAKIWAVIKADAYGHGMTEVAATLATADGFAVARVHEAASLREAGVDLPICVLGGFHDAAELGQCRALELQPVIHCDSQLALIAERAPLDCGAWVKIDTGMHRLGFPATALATVVARLEQSGVTVVGLMSHLANADDLTDDYTSTQILRFHAVREHSALPASLANSAGVMAWGDAHFDWVRPGIMLYGCSPLAGHTERELGLEAVMTFESRIIAINHVSQGEPVGYGGTWRARRDSRVGVVACGYGDGYPRHAPSGTPVQVAGARTVLVGRVSMDMLTVDLTDRRDACVGDPVELWGKQISVTEVAAAATTISYELLCAVTARVPRLMVE